MATEPNPAKRPAVYRTRFFIASLWSSLVPVGLLTLACVVVVAAPEGNKAIDAARRAAGVGLILVPFFYTGLVIVAYGVARLLHLINLLSRITLLAAAGVLSLAGAGLVSWANAALKLVAVNQMLLFVATLIGSTVGLAGGALLWWRVASRLPPPFVPKKKRRRSHSVREGAGEPEV